MLFPRRAVDTSGLRRKAHLRRLRNIRQLRHRRMLGLEPKTRLIIIGQAHGRPLNVFYF